MAKAIPQTFDGVASVFADYGTSLRGFVRYKLTQRNLEPYFSKKNMRVLDVGGGNGPDTAWLAHNGHRVTMLEPSQEQREYAQRRFDFFLSERARSKINIVAGALDDFPAKAEYDLVLMHGVAMYQENPARFVAEAVRRLRPGGLISLLEKGYYGSESRAVVERDFEGLKRLKICHRITNHIQQEVYAFLPKELQSILKKADTEVLEWSGVRVITDPLRMEVSAIHQDLLDEIIELEYEHGHNSAIRGQGQMLHFIARKK